MARDSETMAWVYEQLKELRKEFHDDIEQRDRRTERNNRLWFMAFTIVMGLFAIALELFKG